MTVDAEEGLTLRADPDKLARVFNNLLKNAAAYSDPGTEIALCARREQNRAVVTVTDTGAEIPPQKLEMIFEKFYRLDSSRSTGTGGAGLGPLYRPPDRGGPRRRAGGRESRRRDRFHGASAAVSSRGDKKGSAASGASFFVFFSVPRTWGRSLLRRQQQ